MKSIFIKTISIALVLFMACAQGAEVSDTEIKQKVEATEWQARKTFKIPEQIYSVALGNMFILAGGMSCVYHIDTTTGTVSKFVLPTPRLASDDGVVRVTPERIDALKIVPNNRFLAQSKSHIRLCDMQGNIIEQIEDSSHQRGGTYFDYIDVEIDRAGKLLVCVKKDFNISITSREAESIRSMPFGGGRMIQMYRYNHPVKDKKGSLKVVASGYGNENIFYYDIDTDTVGERVPMKSGGISVIDDEHAVVYMFDDIHMSSLKDGRCLYTMPLGEADSRVILSNVVDSQGRYITADRSGAIKIWDLENQTCKVIAQLDIPVEEYWGISHKTEHPTFQSLDLNRRTLGDHHFVSAAKDGTVKLWTRVKEAEQEQADAQKTLELYGNFGGAQRDVQGIIDSYVGTIALQARAELQ